ncbi:MULTISPECIES: protein kinase [unclassified Nocardiopsis]|uniref:protein kinase n=1 Tax=unclassified Nocardiopsis TaxID=2649073 RepID=UPI00135C14CF|nr:MULTISPECIES: protein kinase [unclassified Nocardiopsis]
MDNHITQLIQPHTGDIHQTVPVTEGYGASTTAVITGTRGEFFVKATPNRAGGHLDAARREAAVNPAVRTLSPALQWQVENEEWFVLGFEVVQGRTADITPGSADLPRIIDAVDQLAAVPLPEVAEGWEDVRWDRFATKEEQQLLRGDALTHTDLHEHNVLLGEERTWIVDWEWPTRGAEALTPSCLAVQLVAAGHSPAAAEGWVAGCQAWKRATPESLDAFARANARLHHYFAELRSEEKWLADMAVAAQAWAEHRCA